MEEDSAHQGFPPGKLGIPEIRGYPGPFSPGKEGAAGIPDATITGKGRAPGWGVSGSPASS